MNTKAARNTPTTAPAGSTDTSTSAQAPARPAPKLGEIIHVEVDEGVVLINNETGKPFAAGVATPVTVTITVLRRLQDGDFRRVD